MKSRRKVVDSLCEEDFEGSDHLFKITEANEKNTETNILGLTSPTLSPTSTSSKVKVPEINEPKLRANNSSTEEGRQRKAVRKIRSNSLVQTDV